MSSPRSSTAQREAEVQQEHADIGKQVIRRMTETSRQDGVYGAHLNDLPDESDAKRLEEEEERERAGHAVHASRLPPSRAWKTLFSQEIAQDWMLEAQLLALTVSTGIQDATTFGDFNVFTTKQTGNTLFLALYAFNSPVLTPRVEQNVAVSIVSFIVGAAFFGHVGRRVKQRRRLWLLFMNMFQTLLVFAAAAIRAWGPRSRTGGATLGLLTLLSIAASGQIAMAVGVGFAELNTTMITGTLVQLTNDPKVFALNNRARNRRVLFYTSLLAGCFIGAAARYRDAWLGLLLTAVVKLLVSVSFLFNRGIVVIETDDVEEGGKKVMAGTATPISKILWGD